MIKRIMPVVLSLILAQGILFAASPLSSGAPEAVPDFSLMDLKNEQFYLSDFKGKPVVLFFWTTWCPYCREELSMLDDMRAQLSRDGIEIFAVNAGESSGKVLRLLGNRPVSYRVLLDTDYEVAHAFGIAGVPTYILIDKEGRVVFSDNRFPQNEYKDLLLK